jgi:hypothetical protein
MKFKVEGFSGEQLAKRIFFLAYEACGRASGMGVLQERRSVTEEMVWNNVRGQGDYPMSFDRPGHPYGDYVFGRMMKLFITVTADVDLPDTEPRADYQSWCVKYPSYEALATAAVESLRKSPAVAR